MPQIADFKKTVDPTTQYVTLTWSCKRPDGTSTLPAGVTIVAGNPNGALGLTITSEWGGDTNPGSRIIVAPQISSDGLSVSAQLGDLVADKLLLTLNLPFSDNDVLPVSNHLLVKAPQ